MAKKNKKNLRPFHTLEQLREDRTENQFKVGVALCGGVA